jgi:lysophospholipase L1-like esterase
MKPLFSLLMTAGLVVITGCSAATSNALHHAKVDAPQLKTVFMGDSITNLWDAADFGQPYFAPHTNWIGLIGQNSSQLVGRLPAVFAVDQPKILHILTGTNDVYPGWVLCGGSAVFDTCDNIISMVAMARQAGVQPILATIPPWGCIDADNHCALAEETDGSAARYDRTNTLNTWIKSYGAQQGLIVVDYHAALVAAGGEHYKPELTFDGVHPSEAGYAVMTPMAEDAITADELHHR